MARSHPKKFVDFQKPPVVEVVCGVTYRLPRRINPALVGVFWQRLRSHFPVLDEAPPLPSVVMRESLEFEISDLPPLSRIWMLSSDARQLIQLQGDRFIYNWKRAEDKDEYPSYVAVIRAFERYYSLYAKFLDSIDLRGFEVTGLELTYVNHIGHENGLDMVAPAEVLRDHHFERSESRYLEPPTEFHWRSQYPMPNDFGALVVLANTATRRNSGDRLVRVDLTAKGLPQPFSDATRRDWFDTAHERIVRGFCDLTNPLLHDVWGRTK